MAGEESLQWDLHRKLLTAGQSLSSSQQIPFVWLPAKNGSYSASSGYYASIVKEPAPSFFAAPTADFKQKRDKCRSSLPFLRRGGIHLSPLLHLLLCCRSLAISTSPTAIGAGTILPWLLWSIWISRNQRIFKDRHSSPIETLNRALSTSREWLLAQEALRTTPRQVNFVHHRSALPTTVTCHTDALLGEALAIHEALSHASSLGFSNLIEDINSEDPPMELHGSPQYPATIL